MKIFAIFLILILFLGCLGQEKKIEPQISREDSIPKNALKMTPETDIYPPKLHSDEYEEPIPLPYPINTAGGEDSAFIMSDGNTLYFWFTPDVNISPEKQFLDGVTGIYVSKKQDGEWGEPERIFLQDEGKLSLEGCAFVQDDKMWFCSAREGYTGVQWFTADYINGKWQNWENADFNPYYEVGELHITADGSEMYFHSPRAGGKGQYDIWVSKWKNDEWQEPENIGVINTKENEGWPFITQDGSELWFNRTYLGSPAIFRSKKINGKWQDAELIISQFAGEPSLDNAGNIYFTHHFYKDDKMIEADIYTAKKKYKSSAILGCGAEIPKGVEICENCEKNYEIKINELRKQRDEMREIIENLEKKFLSAEITKKNTRI
ncbi:MAG: hypothetical protein ACE5K0_10380 [Candidatus Methanofastidiosia archaeon]